jgi:hypothetical protein
VRWFLENRWTERKTELFENAAADVAVKGCRGDESTLLAMIEQLVTMAQDFRQFLHDSSQTCDPAPIIGNASRMQQLLDDLVSGYARRESTDHGLPL